jgi:signal peptidase II
VDYLDVFVSGYHWPTFNLADSAICIGVASLGLRSLKRPRASGPSAVTQDLADSPRT